MTHGGGEMMQGQQGSEPQVNVGDRERWISAGLGGVMALAGLKRGGLGGLGMLVIGGALVHRGVTGYCHGYAAMGMSTAEPAEPSEYFERGIHVEESFTIRKSPEELYAFWHNFENLPRVMQNLESVKVLDGKRSRWTAKGPAGVNVSWDAEVINDEPNRVIAWRSLEGATVDNAGSVRFVPAGDARTEVRVVIDYIPPAGQVGAAVASLFGKDAAQQIREDLRRFRSTVESGGELGQ
jgi:uncharacterized membrane protein